MAYATPESVSSLVEGLLSRVWSQVLQVRIDTPFPRISFAEAMDRFGSDKPDTRFAMEIKDLSDLLLRETSKAHSLIGKRRVKAICVNPLFPGNGNGNASSERWQMKEIQEKLLESMEGEEWGSRITILSSISNIYKNKKRHGNPSEDRNTLEAKRTDENLEELSTRDSESLWRPMVFDGHRKKHATISDNGNNPSFGRDELYKQLLDDTDLCRHIAKHMNAKQGDLLFLCLDEAILACRSLGKLRLSCASWLRMHGLLSQSPNPFHFLWTIDFPLFEATFDSRPPPIAPTTTTTTASSYLRSTHNPFTAPMPSDLQWLDSNRLEDLLRIRALHYDIVLNGVEIGGGSIRIHSEAMQRLVFEKLGIESSVFSHLLAALHYGCPPHGGLALGFDRLVAVLCNASHLREVIAFPKTISGNELMTGSPAEVSKETLEELGLQLRPTMSGTD